MFPIVDSKCLVPLFDGCFKYYKIGIFAANLEFFYDLNKQKQQLFHQKALLLCIESPNY